MATYEVRFQLANGAILIPCGFLGPAGSRTFTSIVDTGDALGPTFPADVAEALQLPNLGAIEISGATGSGSAYRTQVTVGLAGATWQDVAAVVDPEYVGDPLIGLPFFTAVGRFLEFDFQTGVLMFGDASTAPPPPVESPASNSQLLDQLQTALEAVLDRPAGS